MGLLYLYLCLLVDRAHVYQVVYNKGVTNWRFSIVIILVSRTDVLLIPFWTLLQDRARNHRTTVQEI